MSSLVVTPLSGATWCLTSPTPAAYQSVVCRGVCEGAIGVFEYVTAMSSAVTTRSARANVPTGTVTSSSVNVAVACAVTSSGFPSPSASGRPPGRETLNCSYGAQVVIGNGIAVYGAANRPADPYCDAATLLP